MDKQAIISMICESSFNNKIFAGMQLATSSYLICQYQWLW